MISPTLKEQGIQEDLTQMVYSKLGWKSKETLPGGVVSVAVAPKDDIDWGATGDDHHDDTPEQETSKPSIQLSMTLAGEVVQPIISQARRR